MSVDAAQSDVVKKGLLKYRASKVKGTSGSSAQGPKSSSKPLFLVFRATHNGDKILHIYSNDKKYHEAENPKYRVYLNEATSVYFLTDKRSFCVSMSDGGLLFLDSHSLEDAMEWVRCLNAVLYAKGTGGESTLQYEVDMMPSSILSHQGPSVLELRDHDLILWKSDNWDEIVRWKLNHLRSFKAKKYDLTIVSGKRSSTGLGEFVFKSKHSIQITHAIETVVAKVKYRSSPTHASNNFHHNETQTEKPRSSTALPMSIPDMRDPVSSRPDSEALMGGSCIANIPDFAPPGVYNFLDDPPSHEAYGKLERATPSCLRPSHLMLEAAGDPPAYGRMQRHGSKSPRNSPPLPDRQTPPRRGGVRSPMEEYGKLERRIKSPISPPQVNVPAIKPSKPGYEDIDKDFPAQGEYGKLQRNDAVSPLPITHPRDGHEKSKPSKPGYEDIDLDFPAQNNNGEYGKLERNDAVSLLPIPPLRDGHEKSKPSKPGYEDIDLDFPAQNNNGGYGKLERNDAVSPLPLPPPRNGREMSKSPVLGRIAPPKPAPYKREALAELKPNPPVPSHRHSKVPPLEEYGQLSHTTAGKEDHRAREHSPAPQDLYDTIDDGSQFQMVHPKQYTRLSHSRFTPQTEDYGKLGGEPSRDKFGGSLKFTSSSSSVVGDTQVEGYEILKVEARMKARHTVHNQVHSNKVQLEEYGKLERGTGKAQDDPKARLRSNQEKTTPTPKPRKQTSLDEGYSRLDRELAASRSSFDPYASLPPDPERISISSNSSVDSLTKVGGGWGDVIEEEYSTPIFSGISKPKEKPQEKTSTSPIYSSVQKPQEKKPQDSHTNATPPFGYENTKPLGLTPAQLAASSSCVTASGVPPTVPPRAMEKSKKRYENVGEDGMVLQSLASEAMNNVTTATGNDYVEDIEVITGRVSHKSYLEGNAAPKPLPAPKPKLKPKPKISS